MDEFGVLTERYGLKPQGKSAPMASSRRSVNGPAHNFGIDSSRNSKPSSASHSNSDSLYGSYLDDLNGPFQPSLKSHSFGGRNGDNDLFGMSNTTHVQSNFNTSINYDSSFMGSSNSGSGYVDDIFGGMPGMSIHSSIPSSANKNSGPFEDLQARGKHGNSKTAGSAVTNNNVGLGDLLSGFGGTNTNSGVNITANGTQTTNMSSEDPFVMSEKISVPGFTPAFSLDALEEITKPSNPGSTSVSTSNPSSILRPPPKPTDKIKQVNKSAPSSIDELEKFVSFHVQSNDVKKTQVGSRGKVSNSTTKTSENKEAIAPSGKNQPDGEFDFDSFFNGNSRASSLPKTRNNNSEVDRSKLNRTRSGESHKEPGLSDNMKPSASWDDLSFMFDGSPSIGVFEEIEGEPEDRRKARFLRHKMTEDRMKKALDDMNKREFQSQQEQQERARISKNVDDQIKSWSAGKEGNLRALLSTLQNVLWPECGWQAVSLTDMITSASVKKVYRKATLHVHPDKVQQKGANLQQRYAAEKIFNILQVANTKFSKEELS